MRSVRWFWNSEIVVANAPVVKIDPSMCAIFMQVVKGWKEAMQMMVPGDKWEMYLKPELGYGKTTKDKIPGNSVQTCAFKSRVPPKTDQVLALTAACRH